MVHLFWRTVASYKGLRTRGFDSAAEFQMILLSPKTSSLGECENINT